MKTWDMRRVISILLSALSCGMMSAQTEEDMDAVLKIIGVMHEEEADGQEVEDLMRLLRHPLDINRANRTELESSRLFSSFQIAALDDYRKRHGSIMSFAELARIDGFSTQKAYDLKPFLSIRHDVAPFVSMKKSGGELNGKTSVKGHDAPEWYYALRGKFTFADRINLNASLSKSYDSPYWHPSSYSLSVSWNHRFGKLVVGDYNARFGQGLCVWNSVILGTSSAPSSYMRRASGISQSYSFNDTYQLRGVAGDLSFGKWRFSAFVNIPQLKSYDALCVNPVIEPSANITGYFRFGHIGLTHTMQFSDIAGRNFRIPRMMSSYDWSFCLRGVNIFNETMFDWVGQTVSVRSGIETAAGEHMDLACVMRYLPASDEHGLAVAGEFMKGNHAAVFSVDALYHPEGRAAAESYAIQVKAQGKWNWKINDVLHTELRMTERFRTWNQPFKTDLRADFHVHSQKWRYSFRVNVSQCRKTGLLGYIEVSNVSVSGLKLYMRQGVFMVDEWDDRIYVYERDAPGNFNVPAFYGRGIWSSAYVSWRFIESGTLCCRASYTSYPMMREKKKPGKAELKLQFSLHF